MAQPRAPLAPLISAALQEDKAQALALTPVSRETELRLDRYVELLLQWQAKTNLIAPSTLPKVWTRHIADSLQLLKFVHPAEDSNSRIWVDLGSGGGFPGVVVAAALTEHSNIEVHLVERTEKKAAFLREALRVTGARGAVHAMDIKDFVDSFQQSPDYISARALASLNVLLGMMAPIMSEKTRAILMKGQDVALELTEATRDWKFEATAHRSVTDGGGKILQIQRLERQSGAQQGASR